MMPNECNPSLWWAWYPVWTDEGPRWLTTVWWFYYPTYRVHGRGLYTVNKIGYRAVQSPTITQPGE